MITKKNHDNIKDYKYVAIIKKFSVLIRKNKHTHTKQYKEQKKFDFEARN
jgi:hypothetical protein